MSVIITGRGGRNHTTEKRNLLMKFETNRWGLFTFIYNSRNLLMKFENKNQSPATISTTVEIY